MVELRRVLAIVVVLALSGCRLPELITGPPGTFYDPPAVYGIWWGWTCECAGVRGDLGRIGWMWLEDEGAGGFRCGRLGIRGHGDGGQCYGAWSSPHKIVLARSVTENERAVRHEMLHDLLPDVEHTDRRFIECVGAGNYPGTVGNGVLMRGGSGGFQQF